MLNVFLVVLISTLASAFNISVGMSGLRVSLGIIVLIICFRKYKNLPILITSFLTGLGVWLVRVIMFIISDSAGALNFTIVLSLSLEVLFYVSYSLFYSYLVRNDDSLYKNHLILLLMLCDFGANTVEYFVRYVAISSAIQVATFQSIFLAAFIRSSLIWAISKFVFQCDEQKA